MAKKKFGKWKAKYEKQVHITEKNNKRKLERYIKNNQNDKQAQKSYQNRLKLNKFSKKR